MSENKPLSTRIYNDARDDAVSLLERALEHRERTRTELVASGVMAQVSDLVNTVAYQAQIVAMADMIEHLMPVLTTALADTDEFDALEGLRMDLLRTRASFESA